MLTGIGQTESLVVRCPNWVGDIVMATPVFECLRANFPNAIITALVRPYARGILEDSPWFDHIVDCNDKTLNGLKAIRHALQPLSPTAGLLLTNTTHSYLTFRFAGIRKIYGYQRNLRRFFLTGGPVPQREGKGYKPLPMQDYYLELCRYLGLTLQEAPRSTLYLSEAVNSKGLQRLERLGVKAPDRVIGINPGASFGSSKCWPAEHFARLAELLKAEIDCRLLLLTGPGEESIAEEIVSRSKVEIINTADEKIDLAELKALIKRCSLLITNDTGPRHYAVAFRIPHIVLMGPTNPVYTAANLEDSQVIQKDLPCIPCHKKVCPLGHHACMREITPQEVMRNVRQIMERSAA